MKLRAPEILRTTGKISLSMPKVNETPQEWAKPGLIYLRGFAGCGSRTLKCFLINNPSL